MQVAIKKVCELVPYDRNTKRHDKKQIDNVAKSIEQYGWAQPIVVDKDNNVIIGHCRLLAAKKLRLKEVPCVCMDDLTPEQVNALRIVDNKTNESDWDFDLLAEELPEIDLSMFDFDFGFDDEEEETEVIEEESHEVDLSERTLEPYKYIHYLVSIETNQHDKFVDIMKQLEEMGAEVKMTRNDT